MMYNDKLLKLVHQAAILFSCTQNSWLFEYIASKSLSCPVDTLMSLLINVVVTYCSVFTVPVRFEFSKFQHVTGTASLALTVILVQIRKKFLPGPMSGPNIIRFRYNYVVMFVLKCMITLQEGVKFLKDAGEHTLLELQGLDKATTDTKPRMKRESTMTVTAKVISTN